MRQPGTMARTPARQAGPTTDSPAAERSAIDRSPRALAQRRRIAEAFGDAAAGPPVQRVLNIDGAAVPPERITGKGAFKTRLNAVISDEAAAAGQAPQAVRAQLVAAAEDGAAHDFGTKRDAVRWAIRAIQDLEWAALPQRGDILSGVAPLTEAAARTILHDIETAQPAALQGLQRRGQAFPVPAADQAREQEWGILKSRSRADECVIVIGDDTGVYWGAELLSCGLAIAHAHPYFERGKVRDRRKRISLETKEIADHGNLPPGMIAWDDLAARAGEASFEVSKIFPSASDIQFSAKYQIPNHTVYTPYAVVRGGPANLPYVANPEIGNGHFHGAPRLSFVIENATLADDGRNARCMLRAREGAQVIWSRQVTTNGVGPFGLLDW